jgi:hypothetical protein
VSSPEGSPPRWGRSILAVLAGFIMVVALSLGVDELLHALEVYPPHGEPMPQPGPNLLALTYRVVITIAAAALTAKLAPHRSVASDWRHVWVFGAIGLVLGTIGAITMIPKNFGPAWYPILLAASSLPCAWLGGKLAIRERPAASPARAV